jgi:TonB-like protein
MSGEKPERQILLSTEPVPRTSIVLLSVLAHVVALALIIVFRHATGAHVVPEKLTAVEIPAGGPHVAFNPRQPKSTLPRASAFHLPRRIKLKHLTNPGNTGDSPGLQALRGRAKQSTVGLMNDFKFRQMYGFSPGNYQLAVQISGVVPVISAAELPPRFEQYLIVEVTIDIDGRVADARFVNGMATPKIEETLLSAVREFKYIPAKRDGSPIPCQVDLVIHIPS